ERQHAAASLSADHRIAFPVTEAAAAIGGQGPAGDSDSVSDLPAFFRACALLAAVAEIAPPVAAVGVAGDPGVNALMRDVPLAIVRIVAAQTAGNLLGRPVT